MLVDKWNQLNYNEKLFEEVYQVLGFRFCQFYETSSFEESSAASSGIGSITLFRCPKILDHRWLPVNGETSMMMSCMTEPSQALEQSNGVVEGFSLRFWTWGGERFLFEDKLHNTRLSRWSSTIRGFLCEPVHNVTVEECPNLEILRNVCEGVNSTLLLIN